MRRASGSAAAHLTCVLLVAFCHSSLALTKYYYDPRWLYSVYGVELPERPTCTSHPSEDYFPDFAPHGSPIVSSSISFSFTDASTGTSVTALCPGSSYNILVSFGAPSTLTKRLALLTSDPPVVVFDGYTVGDPAYPPCKNRVDLGGSNPGKAASSFNSTFSVPCDAAGTTLLFRVTAAGPANGMVKRWTTNNITIEVAGLSSGAILPGGQCNAAAMACGIFHGDGPMPADASPSPSPDLGPAIAAPPSPEDPGPAIAAPPSPSGKTRPPPKSPKPQSPPKSPKPKPPPKSPKPQSPPKPSKSKPPPKPPKSKPPPKTKPPPSPPKSKPPK